MCVVPEGQFNNFLNALDILVWQPPLRGSDDKENGEIFLLGKFKRFGFSEDEQSGGKADLQVWRFLLLR